MKKLKEKQPEGEEKKRSPLRMTLRALGFTADAATSVVRAVLKVVGSVLLVLIVSGPPCAPWAVPAGE